MSRKKFIRDPTQEHAIVLLDLFFNQIMGHKKHLESHWLKKTFNKVTQPQQSIQGFFLWGGVGRGKTFLMDLLFDVLPIAEKKRLHYHHFMKHIHQLLGETKLKKNPLQSIAQQLASEFRVLCLDEFMVTDIGDAMILSELLAGMTRNGITLITTSNTAPENLYLDGLQRSQFLKTIDHINQYCHVLHIDGGVDYRVQLETENKGYFCPSNELSDRKIQQWLQQHQMIEQRHESMITVQLRKIEILNLYDNAVWFGFEQICKTNRSRSDYIEITQRFNTVVISHLCEMDDQSNDVTRRFIILIDVLYDAKTDLILSASVDVDHLYVGKFLKFEFRRTTSRLKEMQSSHYLKH